jgi:hypothetical protein
MKNTDYKPDKQDHSLSGNLDFWLFLLLPFQGFSSMCIATVDIEVVQEIYFFCFFFSNTSNDSEKATYFPLFYPPREWYDIAVKYMTESCGMWIVYEFQFLQQYTSFLAFHREPQGTSIPPLNLLHLFCSDIDIWLRVVVQIFLSYKYNVIVGTIPACEK